MLGEHGVAVLWGPAGAGKTRIAQEVVARAGAEALVFENAEALAEALEARGGSLEGAADFWDAQEDVVGVFDGAEAIIDDLAREIPRWRASAGHVRFVITSRSLPQGSALPTVEVGPMDEVAGAALFEAHVRQVRADATAEADLRGLVGALEGNPLSLKLAAARYPILGLSGLLDRAKRPLELLTSDGTNRMRSSIRQSWELLPSAAQEILAATAVFPSTFAFSDVRAVVPEQSEPALLENLERLRTHSMLVSVPQGQVTRLHLSPAIREFAEERLDERAELELRHGLLADHVVRTLADRARTFQRTGQPEALADLVTDAPTAELVLEESLGRNEGERALALGLLLEPVWTVRGALDAARVKLDRILAVAPQGSPSFPRGRQARGRILGTLGRFQEARADLELALSAARAAEDAEWIQGALVDLAVMHHQAREVSSARALYDEVLLDSAGEGTRAEARALANLGALCHDEGETDAARAYYVEAVALLEAIGDARQGGVCAGNLAVLEHESGHSEDADRRFQQAIAWLRRADDGRLTGIALGNYGMYWLERGDRPRAIELLEEAKARLARAGDGRSEALALGRLAAALALEGRSDDAALALSRGERLAARRDPLTRHAVGVQRMLVDLAAARRALDAGNVPEARRLFGAAQLRRDSADSPFSSRGGTPRERSDDVRAALRVAAPLFEALGRVLGTA
jgi:tetratricopeptide (TPR) repeat protein